MSCRKMEEVSAPPPDVEAVKAPIEEPVQEQVEEPVANGNGIANEEKVAVPDAEVGEPQADEEMATPAEDNATEPEPPAEEQQPAEEADGVPNSATSEEAMDATSEEPTSEEKKEEADKSEDTKRTPPPPKKSKLDKAAEELADQLGEKSYASVMRDLVKQTKAGSRRSQPKKKDHDKPNEYW